MSEYLLLAGLGIVAFVIAFIFIKLGGSQEVGGNHYILQILLLAFIMVVFALIGKVGVDNSQDCEWLVANSTVTGNTTSYSNSYVCQENTANMNTSTLFYTWMVRFVYIVSLYLVLYFMYAVLSYFGSIGGKKENE